MVRTWQAPLQVAKVTLSAGRRPARSGIAQRGQLTGRLDHSATFRLGRPLLNEVFYVSPRAELGELTVPTLFLHGTGDTFVPVDSSRAAVSEVARAEVRLVEIDGAQHGFAVHDDPEYRQPQTAEWQQFVISAVTDWMVHHS
jgi:uncharacterized protein